MTITELIEKLSETLEQFGDLEVMNQADNEPVTLYSVEVNARDKLEVVIE